MSLKPPQVQIAVQPGQLTEGQAADYAMIELAGMAALELARKKGAAAGADFASGLGDKLGIVARCRPFCTQHSGNIEGYCAAAAAHATALLESYWPAVEAIATERGPDSAVLAARKPFQMSKRLSVYAGGGMVGKSKPQVITAPTEVVTGLESYGYRLRKPLMIEVDDAEGHATLFVRGLDIWTYAPSLSEALGRLPAVVVEVYALARDDGDREQVECFREHLAPTKRAIGIRPSGRKTTIQATVSQN